MVARGAGDEAGEAKAEVGVEEGVHALKTAMCVQANKLKGISLSIAYFSKLLMLEKKN